MKREIDLAIKIEIAHHKEGLLYELLGKYGDTLPREIKEDMRQYAKDFESHRESLYKILKKS